MLDSIRSHCPTNAVVSKSIDSYEVHEFTTNDFENMDSDCTAITIRLSLASRRRKIKPEILKWVHLPWRYVPAPPKTQNKSLR